MNAASVYGLWVTRFIAATTLDNVQCRTGLILLSSTAPQLKRSFIQYLLGTQYVWLILVSTADAFTDATIPIDPGLWLHWHIIQAVWVVEKTSYLHTQQQKLDHIVFSQVLKCTVYHINLGITCCIRHVNKHRDVSEPPPHYPQSQWTVDILTQRHQNKKEEMKRRKKKNKKNQAPVIS